MAFVVDPSRRAERLEAVAAALWAAAALGPLEHWEPASGPLGGLHALLSGSHGLDRREMDRCTAWATAWTGMHPDLRGFYLRHLSDPAASACLRCALDGVEPEGWALGQLRRLWTDETGYEPAHGLVPWRRRT